MAYGLHWLWRGYLSAVSPCGLFFAHLYILVSGRKSGRLLCYPSSQCSLPFHLGGGGKGAVTSAWTTGVAGGFSESLTSPLCATPVSPILFTPWPSFPHGLSCATGKELLPGMLGLFQHNSKITLTIFQWSHTSMSTRNGLKWEMMSGSSSRHTFCLHLMYKNVLRWHKERSQFLVFAWN